MHTAEAGVEPNGEATGVLVEGGRQGYGTARALDSWSGVHGCQLWAFAEAVLWRRIREDPGRASIRDDERLGMFNVC